jgi:hypothetical protein
MKRHNAIAGSEVSADCLYGFGRIILQRSR